MDFATYLLNMRISGIKCIEKEIRIDFYGKSIDKDFNPEKYRIKGIYGENGSGKSAIVAAVDIVRRFIFEENYLRDIQQQSLLNELINKKTKEFSFCCEFITNIESRLIFEYELKLRLEDSVEEIYVEFESLKYKENSSKNKQKTLFVCENGDFIELNVNEELKQFIEGKTRNLLSKQSALFSIFSIQSENNDKKNNTMHFVYATIFFLMIRTHFDREDIHKDYLKKKKTKELLEKKAPAEIIIRELLKETNTSDNSVPIDSYKQYKEGIKRLEKFVRLFKPGLKKIDIEKKENKGFYECELLMDYGEYRVSKEFESTGIKKIMDLYNVFELANLGSIVFIDELDSNINDIYLCRILEYFKYYGKGQVCFTSHNTDPMNVLKDNNKSIDFISKDHRIVPWVKNGHYSPDSSYKNGMIMGLPFNIDATDFIGIFGREG